MYRKEITERIIYKNLSLIQKQPVLKETINLYLDTYTQILELFSPTNPTITSLIDELSRADYPINKETTNNDEIKQSLTESKTEKVEKIITKQIINIQSNPSLKKSNCFHAKVCYDILAAVHSTNKELAHILWQLKQEILI